MQNRVLGLIQPLILLASLFFGVSNMVHSETGKDSQQLVEESDKKPVKFLFAIDGFSEEQKFAAPRGVFYDKYRDEIYVADTGNNRVAVLDADGGQRFQISAAHRLGTPLDVVVDQEGQIFISQLGRKRLQLFDFRGGLLAELYGADNASFMPGRMCLDAEGKLYVVDREKAEILVYGANGDLQLQFGGKGKGEGRFRLISGIAVDSVGRIYVADSQQIPIQAFDRDGQFLRSFGSYGFKAEDFSFSGDICIDEKDRVWIVDVFRHDIKVFGVDGSFLFHFGTFGTGLGQFFFPTDVALDGRGRVYVLEKGANRLQVFEIQGW